MDISQNIKKYRKAKKFTQKELADYLNVVPTTISAWELGRNKPLMDKVTLMADLFGVSTSDIVGDTYTEDNINYLFNQLDEPHQRNVICYAKEQLNDQKGLISYPKTDEIHTIAAHRVDENETASPEDKDRLMSKLAEMNAKFDASQKRIKELEAKKRGDSGE